MVSMARLQARSVFGRGKRQANATAHLVAFERLAESTLQAVAETRSLMSRMPHDGRPPMVAVARGVAVNGAEVRGSERWAASKRQRQECTRIIGLPLWLTSALDTDTIARHWPLHVETFAVATETAPKGKRRAPKVNAKAERAAAHRAIAGTIRMGEQD